MTNPSPLSEALAEFAARACEAGHPILSAGPGRWNYAGRFPDGDYLTGDPDLTPNDVLDAAREVARTRTVWIHVQLPTATDAVRLAAAVQHQNQDHCTAGSLPAPRSRAPWRSLLRRPSGGRRGDPRRVPFGVLVAEVPLCLVTLTEYRDGHAVHVVEIPAAWLHRNVTAVTR